MGVLRLDRLVHTSTISTRVQIKGSDLNDSYSFCWSFLLVY